MRDLKVAIFAIAFFSIFATFATSAVAQTIIQSGNFDGLNFQTITWPSCTTRQLFSNSSISLQRPGDPGVGIQNGSEPVNNLLQIGQRGGPSYAGLHFCLNSQYGSFAFKITNGSSQIFSTQNIIFPANGTRIGVWTDNPTEILDVNGTVKFRSLIRNPFWAGNDTRPALYSPDGMIYASSVPVLDGPICKKNTDGSYTHKTYDLGALVSEYTDNIPPAPLEEANTTYFNEKFSHVNYSEIKERALERLEKFLPTSEYQKLVVSENINVKIFPNPCTDHVTATSSSTGEVVSMSIFDMTGKKIKSGVNTINTSDIDQGIYVTKILIKK
jgi:hypothetical protein